jgi:low affinity Fe/Cu permease
VNLTIAMATMNDFSGAYFTVQALRLYQDTAGCEILVVDNGHDVALARWCEQYGCCRYVQEDKTQGTAYPRNQIFEHASSDWVLVLDCHVLLWPDALHRLRAYIQSHPESNDLLQGPLVQDGLSKLATHLKPVWRERMLGTWAYDARGALVSSEPFEIGMQGLGLFCCRKAAWPGFSTHFRGFGGEEGYIHRKFQRRGDKVLCLPSLRWLHRFGQNRYQHTLDDTIFNYVVGALELGLPVEPIGEHFASVAGLATVTFQRIVDRARHALPARSEILHATFFERLATQTALWSGSTSATVGAFLVVLLWFLGGWLWWGFGDSYQLVINTGTTIVTFLMVFLIQRSQNKDTQAFHAKLDALIAANKKADNQLIGLEALSEAEVQQLREQIMNSVKTLICPPTEKNP